MSTPWTVPRLWEGRTVAVLASGPSMNVATAWNCRHIPCIAVNRTFELAPWADMLFAHDLHFWQHYPGAQRFAGLRIGAQPGDVDVLTLRGTGEDGFDDRPDCIRTGGNSGHCAVHIAAHAGAARILLYGFDMRPGHWHREYEGPLSNTEPGTYPVWRARLEALIGILRGRGVEVIWDHSGAIEGDD